MRNTWLVARREYLERVRTRTFLITTLLMPVFMVAVTLLPSKLATMRSGSERKLVAVVSDVEFGELLRASLVERAEDLGVKYRLEISTDSAPAARALLSRRVDAGEIDAYLWATEEALAARNLEYGARSTADVIEIAALRTAVTDAALKQRLGAAGIAAAEVDELLRRFEIDTIRIQAGKQSKASGRSAFFAAFVMIMLLYTTVLLYGVSVMRSVLEEKSSRVMEVLLSSLTAKELMTGKLLGVGAVGLTQMTAWAAMAGIFALPGVAAGGQEMFAAAGITAGTVAWLVLFFLLGYLLYSVMFAALGAMVNSEQEAQQVQFVVVLPLILCMVFMPFVIRQPDSPLAVVASLVPFFSPLLMFLRVVVRQPPLWQIVLSLALMAGTIYGVLVLCSRIYRVGVLMYGKRPTLPELLKWLKYA